MIWHWNESYCVHRKVWLNITEHTFYISEANICHWKNSNSVFSCKATVKYFTWMEGKHPEVDDDLLRFITKTYVKI